MQSRPTEVDLLRFKKHWSRWIVDVELSRQLKLFNCVSLPRLVRKRLGLGLKEKKGKVLNQNQKYPGKRKIDVY